MNDDELHDKATKHYFQWGEENGLTLDQPGRYASEITREGNAYRVLLRSGDRLLYDYWLQDDGFEYSVNH